MAGAGITLIPSKEKRNLYYRIYREHNKSDILENQKRYRKNNFNTIENSRLNEKYGISLEHYEEMYLSQNGLCAICGEKETTKSNYTNQLRKLSVDYDKETKIVRGLLCGNCNLAIGYFDHNIDYLKSALEYLM